jgi:hypothetical protein
LSLICSASRDRAARNKIDSGIQLGSTESWPVGRLQGQPSLNASNAVMVGW